MKIGIYIFCILLWACNAGAATTGNSVARDSAAAHTISDPPAGYLFVYKNDSLEQKMRVAYNNKKQAKMPFSLIVTNTRTPVSDTVTGTLERLAPEGDSESDNADDGAFFFYDNWNYTKGKCQLNFRIDKDAMKYIRIQEFDCANLRKPGCPFETKGVLKRADIR